MRRMTFRCFVAAALVAAGVLHDSAVVGQTPEQTKMWEAQRAQMQADEKVKAERLAREREARRADPMAWVRTLDPMLPGGWVFRRWAPTVPGRPSAQSIN